MASRVEVYTQPIQGDLYVVGDLHGCYDLLMQRLDALQFNPEQDLLVSVGDLVDRGNQSLACVGLLSEPWFKAIRGNHEQLCIDSLYDDNIRYQHMRADIGGAWFQQLDHAEKTRIAAQFDALPIMLQIRHRGIAYGFVHADIERPNWQQLSHAVAQGQTSAVQTCLWGRARVKARPDDPDFPYVDGIDAIFLGHTPIKRPRHQQNCCFIDTGAVFGGELTVLKVGR